MSCRVADTRKNSCLRRSSLPWGSVSDGLVAHQARCCGPWHGFYLKDVVVGVKHTRDVLGKVTVNDSLDVVAVVDYGRS